VTYPAGAACGAKHSLFRVFRERHERKLSIAKYTAGVV
jgi:hypothetical protein